MITERRQGLMPRSRPQVARAPSQRDEGLLLVAHGSSCLAGADEARTLARHVAAARPDVAVGMGFLELADPPAGEVLEELVARGCRRITVQPLMLLAAGHGKSDVPAIALEARRRHPEVEIVFGSPLGVVPELLAVAGANLRQREATELPLLVVARGTSDPDANGEAVRAARLLAEWAGARSVEVGFTGVTWPTVPEALERMARLGHERIALFFWFLATGKLIERAREQVEAFERATGATVVDAGYLGPDPNLVPVILQRWQEALAGAPRVNCDTCSYRAAWPGLEDRVGQAQGVGHSHLAEEHRSGHRHDHHSSH